MIFFGNLANNYFLEKVSFLKEYEGDLKEKYFKVDYSTGKREEVEYREENENKMVSLKAIGLNDYVGYEEDNIIYIYDKDGNLVNTFYKKENSLIFLGGKAIYQVIRELDSNDAPYSFIKNDTKYILETKQINLLTNEEKDLKLNYLIEGFESFKDEKGNFKYSYIRFKKIREDKTLEINESYSIIDANGKLLKELAIPSFNNLYIFDNYYVDLYYGKVYDEKLNLLYTNEKIYKLSSSENVIFTMKNLEYGLIDKNGNVILDNEYTNISEDFIDGKIFARGADRKYYLISADGSKEELNYPNISLLHNGIIFTVSQSDDNFKFTFLNFKKEKLVEYDSSTLSFTKINISNVYGDYEIYYMNENNKKIVVHNISSR